MTILPPAGYFEIGIFQPRNQENIGTLWRTAYQLGASGIFIVGRKQRHQTSDLWRVDWRIPYRQFDCFDDFLAARPVGAQLVGVEFGGEPLGTFRHPARAIYLLGSETNGLPGYVMEKCDALVEIETVRELSFNVAVSGAIVLYDRLRSGAERA